MPPALTHAVALIGVYGHVVEVETHIANSVPGFSLVGLPDAALNEARDRVRAAIDNSGYDWPQRRLVVGLSPATLRKTGSRYDLGIAIGVLAAAGVVQQARLDGVIFLGELGLDGRLRPIRGTLPSVLAASAAGFDAVVLPEPNVAEARLAGGIRIFGARSLRQVVAMLRGDEIPDEPRYDDRLRSTAPDTRSAGASDRSAEPDLADVLGQTEARRALEVAAAGGHHVFLTGPPGCGKTMLAERLPGLLPGLSRAESLEVSAIHSVAGVLPEDAPLIDRPPFAYPHHSATSVAIVGGGSGGSVYPGAISLAHRGVLLLDEAPEFRPAVLESLRQPLEKGEIAIARGGDTVRFPARFQLVMTANPCPCGRADGLGDLSCTCTPYARDRYQHRVSGPIRDRIDICLTVAPVPRTEMLADRANVETSERVAARVAAARARQAARYRDMPWSTNAAVPGQLLRRRWPPKPGALTALGGRAAAGLLTARGGDRVLRLAWTLADLAARDRPNGEDLARALTLRLGTMAAPMSGSGMGWAS